MTTTTYKKSVTNWPRFHESQHMIIILWLKKIICVIGVLRRTVVSDWRFDNLCRSHLQSQVVVLVSWKFKNPGERFHWSNSYSVYWPLLRTVTDPPSQDSNHRDDLFQSRYVTPGFKPFSYLWLLLRRILWLYVLLWKYALCKLLLILW